MRGFHGGPTPRTLVLGLMAAALAGAAVPAAYAQTAPPVPPKESIPSVAVNGDESGSLNPVAAPGKPSGQELAAGGVKVRGVAVKRIRAAGGKPKRPPVPAGSKSPPRTDVVGGASGAISGDVAPDETPRSPAELTAAGVKAP